MKVVVTAAGAFVLKPSLKTAGEEPGKNFQGKNSLEVLEIEERRGMVRLSDTPVICYPLRGDYFLSSVVPIEKWRMGGADVSFSKIFSLKSPDGNIFRVALLHHAMGIQTLALAFLDEGINGRSYMDEVRSPEIADFTMIGEYYPNKQYNLLEGAAQFLRHQISQGGYREGETYSTMDILNISGDINFRYGLINGDDVRGAGVCGLATMLAHTLSQTNTRFDEHQMHSFWSQYWVSPFDPEISLDNDTAISRFGDTTYDFRWTPDRDFYIGLDAALAIRGPRQTDGHVGRNSRLLLTLSLTSRRPNLEEQLEKIERIQETYHHYNLHGGRPAPEIQEGRLEQSYLSGENAFVDNLYRSVRNEEDRSGFEQEMRSDPLLGDILALQLLVERYTRDYPYQEFLESREKRLGDYIRESDWYTRLDSTTRENIEEGLEHLNYQTWRFNNEVTQCVAWVIFLSCLGRANSPLNIGGWDIEFARDLVPERLRNGSRGPDRFREGNALFVSTERVEDFEPGDLFVSQSVPFGEGAGHVGAIVAKKEINGKIALLVSDANRGFDGKVRLFKVDDTNKYAIFGRPPINWVGIRRTNV